MDCYLAYMIEKRIWTTIERENGLMIRWGIGGIDAGNVRSLSGHSFSYRVTKGWGWGKVTPAKWNMMWGSSTLQSGQTYMKRVNLKTVDCGEGQE